MGCTMDGRNGMEGGVGGEREFLLFVSLFASPFPNEEHKSHSQQKCEIHTDRREDRQAWPLQMISMRME